MRGAVKVGKKDRKSIGQEAASRVLSVDLGGAVSVCLLLERHTWDFNLTTENLDRW